MAVDLFCKSAIAFSKGVSADAIAVRRAQDASRSLLLHRESKRKAETALLKAHRSNSPMRGEIVRKAQTDLTRCALAVNRAIAIIEEGESALERNGVSDWSERLQRLQDLRVSR